MHLEALTTKGKELFPKLAVFEGFYLAGGTALALQIGHRISVDFDLFTEEKIKKTLLKKAEEVFYPAHLEIIVNNSGELTLFADGVKITFLAYPFSVALPLLESGENITRLLSVKEIAATKAYTVGRRGELKDYVDLFFILKDKHATLAEVFELAEKKYGEAFDTRLFLEQLLYLEDVEDANLKFLKDSINREEVQKFFEEQVRGVKITSEHK